MNRRARRYRSQPVKGMVCGYCGCEMLPGRPPSPGRPINPRTLTRDHVFPQRSRSIRDNCLIMCCLACNQAKGGLHPLEWLRVVPTPGLLVEKLRKLGVEEAKIRAALACRLNPAYRGNPLNGGEHGKRHDHARRDGAEPRDAKPGSAGGDLLSE